MPIQPGIDFKPQYPIKDNDPDNLLEGQLGLKYRGVDADPVQELWMRAPRLSAGDPASPPFRAARIDEIQGYVGEVPSGVVDGVNTLFVVSEPIVDASTVDFTLDGLRLKPVTDFTVSGTDITLMFAPAVNTEIYVTYGTKSMMGVTSFNGRSGGVNPQTGDYDTDKIANQSLVPGSTDTAALNYLLSLFTTDPIQVISSGTGTVDEDARVVYLNFTASGTMTVTIPTNMFVTGGIELEFHDIAGNASVNDITIVGENSEPINGDAGGLLINTDGINGAGACVKLRLIDASTGARISGGSL